ncbi:MAG: phenylacetate--CoA ligase family protein [Methylococcaceae bacterium]|nr:phenylacetate--CoA ligase family protein [Methylococcaceae bacterium]
MKNDFWRELIFRAMEKLEDFALADSQRFLRMLQMVSESQALKWGRMRAETAARSAWRKVPAYRDFLAKHGLQSPDVPFEKLPVMSKKNYIGNYSLNDRCAGGSFCCQHVSIDESSGSTGMPYNWVRGLDERRRIHRTMARMAEFLLGERSLIVINAFSMGAWATGVHIAEAMELYSVVKSTGADLEKVISTLETFGPYQGYFILGYPPFIKHLIDTLVARNFPIDQYELHALVGGEAMSEDLRRYVLRYFRTFYSGYGASDLEVGMAIETPEAVRIRSLIHDDIKLRTVLLEGDHRVPMVFQYDPRSHYMEVNSKNELIITLTNSRVLSPRIRYNIGDEARLFSRKTLVSRMCELGHPLNGNDRFLPLPYVFIYGRADHTISIMGANIYPEDVERAIFTQPELAGFASFSIRCETRNEGSPFPHLSIEWENPDPPALPLDTLAHNISREVAKINADYRAALTEFPEPLHFELDVYGLDQGPFTGRNQRIKQRYIESPGL